MDRFEKLMWAMTFLFIGPLLVLPAFVAGWLKGDLYWEEERDSAIIEYFDTDEVLVLQSYGSGKYEVLTQKGLFVVEYADGEIRKALRKE